MMKIIFIAIIVLLILLTCIKYFEKKIKLLINRDGLNEYPYRKTNFLLTKAERAFFEVLQTVVGDKYLLFSKIRLADLVYVPEGTKHWRMQFNRISSKHADFVICDKESVSPKLVIELDDSLHSIPSNRKKDVVKDEIFHAAGIALLRIKAKSAYDFFELKRTIETHINGGMINDTGDETMGGDEQEGGCEKNPKDK